MGELNLLQKKIMKDGVIKAGNVLKVDSFLNHQIDVPFISELGKEFKKLFGDRQVDKILTIEASGIGIACLTESDSEKVYTNLACLGFTHPTHQPLWHPL